MGTRNPTLLIASIRILFLAGEQVCEFERKVASFTGPEMPLQLSMDECPSNALLLAGVGEQDEVITQALTFVATCNAFPMLEPIRFS